jgi:deoxyribodipyrimidine photolyase
VLRLKPGTVLELYREVFDFAKTLDPYLVFGKIEPNNPIANEVAKLLSQKWKPRVKYEFGNALYLLENVQDLLANYPLQFSKPANAQLQNKALI